MDDVALPKKRPHLRYIRIVIWFVLLVIAFSLIANYGTAQLAKRQQVYDNLAVLDSRLQNIENSIVLHEKRINDLEQKQGIAKPGAPVTQIPADDARIVALEKEIAALKAGHGNTPGGEALYPAIHLLSTFWRFSDKVVSGKPFAAELSEFTDLNPEAASSKPIIELSPYADEGVPTLAVLLGSFDDAVEQLNGTEATPPAGATLWERFVYTITHLITIRRIDEAQTDKTTDAILARAQAHLENEEIEAAIAEIKSLPETARSNFVSWLEEAQAAAEIPALMGELEEEVLQKAFGAKPASGARSQ